MIRIAALCRAISERDSFRSFILALIVLNALCMGAEATPGFASAYAEWLDWIFVASQPVFVAEIAIRLIAHHPQLRGFFREFWNAFDFAIVALSLVPAVGGFTLAARLFRVLRIARVVSTSVRAGAPAVALAPAALLVQGYVFALFGFYLFGEWQAEHWGTLARIEQFRARDTEQSGHDMTSRDRGVRSCRNLTDD